MSVDSPCLIYRELGQITRAKGKKEAKLTKVKITELDMVILLGFAIVVKM